MATYKVTKGTVGPFKAGEVITDADLEANPGLGGVKRLRDELKVIEDHQDAKGGKLAPGPLAVDVSEDKGGKVAKPAPSGKS